VTDDLQHAIRYAAWWTRKALDIAGGTTDAHPGVIGHLTAASVQHSAVEQLVKTADR
jgi:hypothetical protein